MGTTSRSNRTHGVFPVHPHVRGDNEVPRTVSRKCHGSPPRAWGQLNCVRVASAWNRFTPTCVGTTRMRALSVAGTTVHPHVRGDNVTLLWCQRPPYGSPPRAWGQLVQTRHDASDRAVHPHVRGDNRDRAVVVCKRDGSPPRAWGQRCGPLRSSRSNTVHPHVRGDNEWWCLDCCSASRFTPTCVGTTDDEPTNDKDISVHPHVRGDNSKQKPDNDYPDGSPPRAWGQPVLEGIEHVQWRFTPTCVGTTPASTSCARRLCGSPPRAWGQRYSDNLASA